MNQPNIILIVSDQHRGDWIGCAGAPFVHTPNMDRLAQGGIRFGTAYCNAPLCGPSRMSMMTGRYPHRTGVLDNSDTLGSEVPTMAHALGLAGYETVLCGRMHFEGPDQRHGFQKRLVGDIVPSYGGGPGTDFGWLRGTVQQGIKSLQLAGPGASSVVDYDLAVTEGCERYIRERTASGAEERPLFMTVGFFAPHSPYVCPPDLYEQAESALRGFDPIPRDREPLHPWMEDWYKRLKTDEISDGQIRTARAGYAGLIGHLDRCIGRVTEAARALSGDTVIVYVSDHGDMAGDRRMFWKQSFYEGAARVPMIWHWLSEPDADAAAGKVPLRGQVVSVPVSLVDLAPTFASLAGAPELPQTDGRDLSPLLFGQVPQEEMVEWEERPVFSELKMIATHSPFRMIRYRQYKLIYHHDRQYPVQLFDLQNDPQEQHDLGRDEAYAEVRERLLSKLLEGWDAAGLQARLIGKLPDKKYLQQWGREVGMGPMDIWHQPVVRKAREDL
jgi:choline-sulfatase